MKMMEIAKVLAAGCAVYVAMAACSASSTDGATASHGGTHAGSGGSGSSGGSAGSAGSASGSMGSGGLGGLRDALIDPVPAAEAQVPPGTATEPCVNATPPFRGGYQYVAEHSYPGTSVTDLARVVALLHLRNPIDRGYTDALGSVVFVQPGRIIAVCSAEVDTVTFIGP